MHVPCRSWRWVPLVVSRRVSGRADSDGNQLGGCRSAYVLLQEEGYVGAHGFGSQPVRAPSSEQHGSNTAQQRRMLEGRAYLVRGQAAKCGDNPVRSKDSPASAASKEGLQRPRPRL